MTQIVLKPGRTTLSEWRDIYRGAAVSLDPDCHAGVARSAGVIEAILARGEPVYGINTGFGKLASIRIDNDDLATLQRNIVVSHAAGVGEPMPLPVVRLMMALKLGSLALGASGVRMETLFLLEKMLAHDLLPLVPCQGSVGASGDLAPLAHMTAAMLGIGDVALAGRRCRPPRRWRRSACAPVSLGAEGRAGAAQRHAVLHRLRARRAVRGGNPAAGRPRDRRDVDRCGARLRHAVRSAHPRAAPPSRTDRGGRGAALADRRQRDPRSRIASATSVCRIPIACAASRR